MAEQATKPQTPEPKPQPLTVAELVRQLHSLPTYGARKAFYEANPALRAVIDPCNFQN
jgi:hypothetical protein